MALTDDAAAADRRQIVLPAIQGYQEEPPGPLAVHGPAGNDFRHVVLRNNAQEDPSVIIRKKEMNGTLVAGHGRTWTESSVTSWWFQTAGSSSMANDAAGSASSQVHNSIQPKQRDLNCQPSDAA